MARILLGILSACVSISVLAQSNRIDIVRHDAPELAHFGEYDIGVRTLKFTNPNQPDILNTVEGDGTAFYDRSLTVEVWYPALLAEYQQPGGVYTTTTRNLASKGYVVASIDHRDSTYEDHQPIASTLYNRPLDQLFVLEQMAVLSNDADSRPAAGPWSRHDSYRRYGLFLYALH